VLSWVLHCLCSQRHFINIGEATTYALGSGIGWALAIIGLAAIREKWLTLMFPLL